MPSIKHLPLFALLTLSFFALSSQAENPKVIMETTLGSMTIELYPDEAPVTVKNFLSYVDSGFYTGTIFHRVIPGFVLQGGGFVTKMDKKATQPPIINEAENRLSNRTGTLSMARTPAPNSATSQFFINLKRNTNLDYRPNQPGGEGYAVFAKVIEGMAVVNKIATVDTATVGSYQNVPVQDVTITQVTRVVSPAPAATPIAPSTPATNP